MEEIIPSLPRQATKALQINPSTSLTPSSPSIETSFAIHELIAGAIAGSAGIFVGHPLDTLKVRMQMLPSTSSTSVSALFFNSQYGSVWKGLLPPVMMAGVLNAQIFFTYGRSTQMINSDFDIRDGEQSLLRDGVCGLFTGLVSAFIMTPTEHVKTRLQTQHKSNVTLSKGLSEVIYRNGLHATHDIYQKTGITGIYRGFAATALRQGPAFAVYFTTYNALKEHASKYDQNNSLITSILAGGVAGSLSWAVTYPVDLIKNRIQAMPLDSKVNHSMVAISRQFVHENGWRALFRGFGLTVIRAFPVNGVIFTTYEFTLEALGSSVTC